MADIITSVPTTVVLAVSLVAAAPTGGTSVAAATGAAAGRKALMTSLKTLVKGSNKVVQSANALRNANAYKKYVIGLESLKAQAGPLLIMFGKWSWDSWKEMWFVDADNKFLNSYKIKAPSVPFFLKFVTVKIFKTTLYYEN